MSKLITILNGPNLNLLGTREVDIYGGDTLQDIQAKCTKLAEMLRFDIAMLQSNSEGQLVDWIQAARKNSAGIVINPAAYSHTSVAIFDALNMFEGPVVEVHISNIHKREAFRHHSFVSARADGIIIGCGTHGYELALHQMGRLLNP